MNQNTSALVLLGLMGIAALHWGNPLAFFCVIATAVLAFVAEEFSLFATGTGKPVFLYLRLVAAIGSWAVVFVAMLALLTGVYS